MSRKARTLGISNVVQQPTLLDNGGDTLTLLDIATGAGRELEPDIATSAGSSVERAPVPGAGPAADDDGPSTAQRCDEYDQAPVTRSLAPLNGPTRTMRPASPVDRDSAAQQPGARRPSPLPTQLRDPRRYHVLGEHGRGGLGRVSRAHDRELRRDVAIKELLERDDDNEARFQREALITARLEHPGIVPVYETGRWPDGTPFYAMKLVAGRSLRDLIAERTTVEHRLGLLHHVIAVADAIAYAHGRNVIHRDLKPANVIVGDFGETIVIDWGLAKDLNNPDEPAAHGGTSPGDRSAELTGAGTVLGTPAYMAPEQERGEQVDQRADVFAIGAMLWELCTLRKTPPDTAALRHRVLRQSGIDRDLAAIIDKALDPAPDRRYRDAGALAADLKAFKSGVRIAARSYSPLGVLTHWTRRHRGRALSIAGAIALAIVVGALYVRNIAVERDRADRSERAAERARQSAESSLDDLMLKHAQLLLTTDPSAAVDALASYRGKDASRADQIRAEAIGRGRAVLRAQPHTEAVYWAMIAPDGAILSLSGDGTISRLSHNGASEVLARGVARTGIVAYSASHHLLAYACEGSELCLFDAARGAPIAVAAPHGEPVSDIAFSPDGSLIATMSRAGVLRVLDVGEPARPTVRLVKSIKGAGDVRFLDDTTAIAATRAGIELVPLTGESQAFAVPDSSYWDVDTHDHALALATTTGQAIALAVAPLRITARAALCHGPVVGLSFIAGRHEVAYACQEGTLGTWNPTTGAVALRARLDSNPNRITTSAAGDYIVAASGNGTITVLDLITDLISTYKGHEFRLSTLVPPTSEQPVLISGDVRGALRVWPVPQRFARVVASSSSHYQRAIFDEESSTAIATNWLPALTVFSPGTGVRTAGPHEVFDALLEHARGHRVFAAYGLNTDLVEIWSSATLTRTRVIATGQGALSQLGFVADSDDFVAAGHDGRLIRWTVSGEPTLLAHADQPVERFAATGATQPIAFSTADGALWRTDGSGTARPLRGAGSHVNQMLAAPGRDVMFVGYANGELLAIDTRSWQSRVILHSAGPIRQIAATENGRTVVVATNDGAIQFGTPQGEVWSTGTVEWSTWDAHARYVTVTAEGLVMASRIDGAIWLFMPGPRSGQGHWLCLPTETANLGRISVTRDGMTGIAVDQEGRLIWLDLKAARELLTRDRPPNHDPGTAP
jgi:WD40 repeat protein